MIYYLVITAAIFVALLVLEGELLADRKTAIYSVCLTLFFTITWPLWAILFLGLFLHDKIRRQND